MVTTHPRKAVVPESPFPTVWRPLLGFPGYFISRYGAVTGPRGLLRKHLSDSGYQRVRITRDGRRCSVLIHRAVLLTFGGPPSSKRHHAAHGNGVQHDNRADNLAWKLPTKNEADKRRHGSHRNGRVSRRSPAEVVEAIRARARRESFSSIARTLGMHRSSVARIARGLRCA